MRPPVIILGLVLPCLLTGCGEPTLDGSSPEAMKASMEAAIEGLRSEIGGE